MEHRLFERILSHLPEYRNTRSGLIRLFYAERTPAHGPAPGLMGVEGKWLLDAYVDGIDAACNLFRQLEWPEPTRCPDASIRADLEGFVPALVFDVDNFMSNRSPFTFYFDDHGYRSFIGLPSEPWETTRRAGQERARIIGAHETTHVYTHVHKNLVSDGYSGDYGEWGWFDEATAVYVEWILHPRCPERHRFARDWISRPDLCLEQYGSSIGYETAWFVAYLVKKHGWQIITDVWRHHKHGEQPETPIQAIDRWFRSRRIAFRDVLHDVKDEFASGYCIESFLTANVCPRLHKRFGNRWPCCSFNLSRFTPDSHKSDVEPLGCQYYRIKPKKRTNAFRVEVQSSLPLRQCGLKRTYSPSASKSCSSHPRLSSATARLPSPPF